MKKIKFSIFYPVVIVVFALTAFALMQFRIGNLKEISIIDEQNNYYLKTYANSVDDILEICAIDLQENDRVNVAFNEKIVTGMQINIHRSFDLTIHDGGETKIISTTKNNVRDILLEHLIEVNEYDIVAPFMDAKISAGTNITITRVWDEVITEEVIMPYNTEINLVNTLEDSEVELISEGSDGLMEVEFKLRYENGKIVSKNLVNERVVIEPINEVKNKGRDSLFVTSRGMPFRYSKVIICEATAYDLSYESCGKYPGDPAYGITYSGTQARPGVIAVDPRTIPLRSKVYVESLDSTADYGFASAEDTGSAIKGNKIDLFINNKRAALRYGRRKVRVYIIEDDVAEEDIKGYGY